MKTQFVILILATLLVSCDYYTDQKVLVVDKLNHLPIQSANVVVTNNQAETYEFLTDSTGFCHMSQLTGDLSKREIHVMKDGYSDFFLTVELDGDNVTYKQKQDLKNSEYTYFAVLNDTLVVYMERK